MLPEPGTLPSESSSSVALSGDLKEHRFNFRHLHAITGTFVLVILLLVVTLIAFTSRSQRWFLGNVTLRIVFPEGGAAGIRQGSEVYFLGTLMGTVAYVSVDPTGRMEAEVNIRRDFFLFVRADSSAVVKRKFGVVGDAYFEITRGHGQTLPEKNARIVCNELLPSALETAVEEVRREAVPALQKLTVGLAVWTELGSNLLSTRDRLDNLIARAERIATELEDGKGTAGRLLTDATTANELQALLVKAQAFMDNLDATLETVHRASTNVWLASTNLPAISERVAQETQDLPGLVAQTQISMRELQRLIEALQHHWLVRKYLNATDPAPVRPGVGPPPVHKPLIRRSPNDAAR